MILCRLFPEPNNQLEKAAMQKSTELNEVSE